MYRSIVDLKTINNFYKQNPAAFIRDSCKIFDSESLQPIKPFKLFKYQEEIINDLKICLDKGKSLLAEKSRQVGLSWCVCSFILWAMIFYDGFTCLILSYKEKLVDDFMVSSLMGRIRFMIDRLPIRYRNEFESVHCKIWHTNNNFILGETSTSKSGRGTTFKMGFWDEVAFTENSELLYASFVNACKTKCYVSTPNGKSNIFYKLRFKMNKNLIIKTVSWRDDPRRSQQWYEAKKQIMDEVTIGQELDISYVNSAQGRVYTLKTDVHLKDGIEFQPEWRDYSCMAWDFGIVDLTVGVIIQTDWEGNLIVVDEISGSSREIRFYIDLVSGVIPKDFMIMSELEKEKYEQFRKRALKYNYKSLVHVAGHESQQKSILNKKSIMRQFLTAGNLRYEKMRSEGIPRTQTKYINMKFHSMYSLVEDRIRTCRRLLDPSHPKCFISSTCPELWENLPNYTLTKAGTPKHDQSSHYADALGYGLLYFANRLKVLSHNPLRSITGRTYSPALLKLAGYKR